MMKDELPKLKIDKEFQTLLYPLSEKEYKQLEENILADGCRDPITVWRNTIIDGHNRYEICTKHNLPFLIKKVSLKNREEAIAWICKNQLGRRNISEGTRRYLIGKRYEMEKLLGAHNAKGFNQYNNKEVRSKMLTEPEPEYDPSTFRTREKIGKEYHISHATVSKYNIYSQALDRIGEVVPELVPEITSGRIKMSHEHIVTLSRMQKKDLIRAAKELLNSEPSRTGYINAKRELESKMQIKIPRRLPENSVKTMPAYDPDAEVSSLIFTIPSWVNSINRVSQMPKLIEVSSTAKTRLKEELIKLQISINKIISAIKENSDGRLQ